MNKKKKELLKKIGTWIILIVILGAIIASILAPLLR